MPNDKPPNEAPSEAEYGLNVAWLVTNTGMTGVQARALLGGTSVNGRTRGRIALDTAINSQQLTKS